MARRPVSGHQGSGWVAHGLLTLGLLSLAACSGDRASANASPSAATPPAPSSQSAPPDREAEHATQPQPASAAPPVAEQPSAAKVHEAARTHLLAVARRYREWGRVDEQPHPAPTLCRLPVYPQGFPSHARISRAEASEHAGKLYYLFAGRLVGEQALSERAHYIWLKPDPAQDQLPLGFTVVKESWTTRPGARPSPLPEITSELGSAPAPIDWVEVDGQVLRTDALAGLFVMYKAGPADTPGTDQGWIYGTLDASGEQVTSIGRLEACMNCHEAADHERLFGLQPTPSEVTLERRGSVG